MFHRIIPAAGVCLALLLAAGPLAPLRAETMDQRIAAVDKSIETASDMFNAAKKGHLPSLDAINDLYARMTLTYELFEAAVADAKAGKPRRARAELDAAEYMAGTVYEASKH